MPEDLIWNMLHVEEKVMKVIVVLFLLIMQVCVPELSGRTNTEALRFTASERSLVMTAI